MCFSQGCTIAVLQDGSVWSFGNNSGGRLGHDCVTQKRSEALVSASSSFRAPHSKHSARPVQSGLQNSPVENVQSSPIPRQIESLRHVHVTQVSCRYHLLHFIAQYCCCFMSRSLTCPFPLYSATFTLLHAVSMAGAHLNTNTFFAFDHSPIYIDFLVACSPGASRTIQIALVALMYPPEPEQARPESISSPHPLQSGLVTAKAVFPLQSRVMDPSTPGAVICSAVWV